MNVGINILLVDIDIMETHISLKILCGKVNLKKDLAKNKIVDAAIALEFTQRL